MAGQSAPEVVRLRHNGVALEVAVVRSSARHASYALQVLEGGEAIVRVPLRTPKRDVQTFVESKAAWLAAALERVAARPPVEEPGDMDGAIIPIWGVDHTIKVLLAIGRPRPKVTVDDTKLAVMVGIMDAPGRVIARWLAAQAVPRLRALVDQWSPAVGVSPGAVLVREQKTRWGSCAHDGSIRFNWRLALLDPWVVEGVVVHELCHLLEANHGPAFWEHVVRAQPDHMARRKRLREIEKAGLPNLL